MSLFNHVLLSRALQVPAVLFLAACSGGIEANVLGSVPDAGDVVPDAHLTPRSDAGLDAATNVHPDGGVDSSPDAASGGPIDPLVVGSSWTYDFTELGTYPFCPGGSHVGSVASTQQYAGRQAYEVVSLCQGLGPYYYSESGDLVSWDPTGTWDVLLDPPVVEGHTWAAGSATYIWHDLGTVVVPAGSFHECFEAQDTGGPSYTVFCRGTGPIHWHYDDGSGNGYDALLTSKNF